MLAGGEYLLGTVDPRTVKISAVFGGRLGYTFQQLCGALSGGVILIGALYGRTDHATPHEHYAKLVAEYQERLEQVFGHTACADLLESGYGTDDLPCPVLTEHATRILFDVIKGDKIG